MTTARALKTIGWMLVMSGTLAAVAGVVNPPAGSLNANPLLGAADYRPSPDRPAGWRGDGTGYFPGAQPISRWSVNEGGCWQAEVGAGQSSPVVVGPRVFITVEPDSLICLDTDTGRELWRKTHRYADLPGGVKDPKQSSQYGDITPTPVSDGKYVWVFVGTGMVACYDLEGACRWIKGFDMPLATMYGRTASPVLVGDRLLIHFGPLVCLDAATGKLLWRNNNAKASYGTPAQARIGDSDVVITPKGDLVRVADGKILASNLGNCMYTSPVVQNRVVYFLENDTFAVRLPDQVADPIQCQELWSGSLNGEFYASPVVDAGRIYTADQNGNYYVIDAHTGKTIFTQPLKFSRPDGAHVYPSLCLAGKFLFIGTDSGEMLTVEPGDQGTVIDLNSLPRGSGATPAFSGKRVFIRGGKLLYCLGAP